VNPKKANRPVFDASAVLALMLGESGADALGKVQRDAIVDAVNLAEVLAKLLNRGVPLAEAQAAYDALHVETAPFEPALAAISAGYVRKGLSLGDRCFLAASQWHGEGWTSDRDLGTLFKGVRPQLKFFR
jgi:PIN domain nuclease of toxin-antitoxin system